MDKFKTLMPWFRLVRLPNLLTVPGDALAGFLLAAATLSQQPKNILIFATTGAALCLYLFGLILNDIMDIEIDRRERPDRPLPAGLISVHQARMAAIAMALSGLNLALVAGRPALCLSAALAGLIVLYNALFKRIPILGVLTMGLCRGLSLLLGSVAAYPDLFTKSTSSSVPIFVAACGLTLYVAGFSEVAKNEMDESKPLTRTRWIPFFSLLFYLPAVLITASTIRKFDSFTSAAYVFLMVMTLLRAWLLGGMLYRLQPIPVTVGGHIRNLLMVQACLCVTAGRAGLFPAAILVVISFVFKRLAARFYSS